MCDVMRIDQLTPNTAILQELGDRLTRIRKQQKRSQDALAKEAGIGVATLRRIEDGRDGQLGSWIKILKALQMDGAIDALLPEDFKSPMAEVQSETKRGQTRRAKQGGSGFSWGDERP